MPLRAIVHGKEVIAPLLSNEEWTELRKAIKSGKHDVIMPCCGSRGYPRTSKLGLQHFAHNRGAQRIPECDRGETLDHLGAKAQIAKACHSVGYEPVTEATGDGWRADVLAIKGKTRIAFEIQWSPQTLEETIERQERYKQADLRCCWFFRKPPRDFQTATHELPLFPLELNDQKEYIVNLNPPAYWAYPSLYAPQTAPLRDFVRALLSGHVKYCKLSASNEIQVRIVFFEMECWKCRRISHVYYVDRAPIESLCGLPIHVPRGEAWDNQEFNFSPEILAAVAHFLKSDKGKHLVVGQIKQRFSKTVGRSYMSFGCAYCDSIFGDFFVSEAIMEVAYDPNPPDVLETTISFNKPIEAAIPHWCVPRENGGFCCD
jgi:hypothetical protein